MFNQLSFAVTVKLSATPAVGVVDAADNDKLAAEPGPTVTDRPVPFEIDPSVTVTLAVSALYNVITPLLLPETVATPLVNVTAVADPNAVAVPELLLTVGCVPLAAVDAPPNVRLLPPV